jgi:hypothetical protein
VHVRPGGIFSIDIAGALRRDKADFEKNKATGWPQGSEMAVKQFVEHVIAMK